MSDTKPSKRLVLTLQAEADRAMLRGTFDVDEFAEEVAEHARAVFRANREARVARDIEQERQGRRETLVEPHWWNDGEAS